MTLIKVRCRRILILSFEVLITVSSYGKSSELASSKNIHMTCDKMVRVQRLACFVAKCVTVGTVFH